MPALQQVQIIYPAASSTPITGTILVPGTPGDAQYSAEFSPQLGREMNLTLIPQGSYDGSVQIQRSTDGGDTWNDITIGGGQQWGYYIDGCDEAVDTPTDAAGIYRLKFLVTTGSIYYRLAQ